MPSYGGNCEARQGLYIYADGTVIKESKVFGNYKWVIDFNSDVKHPLSLQFEKTIQNKEANATMLVFKKEEAKSKLDREEGDWVINVTPSRVLRAW